MADIIEDAYRTVAPKTLVAALDAQLTGGRPLATGSAPHPQDRPNSLAVMGEAGPYGWIVLAVSLASLVAVMVPAG